MPGKGLIYVKVDPQPGDEMNWEEGPGGDGEKMAQAGGCYRTGDEALCEWFSDGGCKDHVFSDTYPTDSTPDVVCEGHPADCIVGSVAGKVVTEIELVPEGAGNHVILG